MKRNAGLLLAAAMAAGAMGPQVGAPGNQVQVQQQRTAGPAGSLAVPQGGIGSLLGAMLQSGGGRGWGVRRPTFRNYNGYSCAEGKRRARRVRNKLRAKGQHRSATR